MAPTSHTSPAVPGVAGVSGVSDTIGVPQLQIPRVCFPIHTPKPISNVEFAASLASTCPPRYPRLRATRPWSIALAFSGGVDSMALALLFSRLLAAASTPLVVTGYPVRHIHALTVDHRLRPSSTAEAHAVRAAADRLGLSGHVSSIPWRSLLNLRSNALTTAAHREVDVGAPGWADAVPNIEALARIGRYWKLGRMCDAVHADSLFLAHHRDDDYETVIMRLVRGGANNGGAGLRGIAPAADIPECFRMYGVWRSGLLRDMAASKPVCATGAIADNVGVLKRQPQEMHCVNWDSLQEMGQVYQDKDRLELEMPLEPLPDPVDDDFAVKSDGLAYSHRQSSSSWSSYCRSLNDDSTSTLPHVATEAGGIRVYRPLLPFDKARLVATCEEAGLPWFEDATNADPTLTLRNAVRNVVRSFNLPLALRKDAVLDASARLRERWRAQEAQAARWIRVGAVVKNFCSNVGTLEVDLAAVDAMIQRTLKRRRQGQREARDAIRNGTRSYAERCSAKRREIRGVWFRTVAALLVRKLIAVVSPLQNYAAASDVGISVKQLFPSLIEPGSRGHARKRFVNRQVIFEPLRTGIRVAADATRRPPPRSLRWRLSRAPFGNPGREPLPRLSFRFHVGPNSGFSREAPAVTCSLPNFLQIPLPVPLPEPHPDLPFFPLSPLMSALWDGRFWIRLRTRLHGLMFRIAPFRESHAAQFRAALGPENAARLDALLRSRAPGKVRWTLPAVYVVVRGAAGEVANTGGLGTEGRGDGVRMSLSGTGIGTDGVADNGDSEENEENEENEDDKDNEENEDSVDATRQPRQRRQRDDMDSLNGVGVEVAALLALPTLGVGLPGLGGWLEWDVRYKKVDGRAAGKPDDDEFEEASVD